MIDFENNVIQWASDRNILNGSTVDKQLEKLAEEFVELCLAIGKNDEEEFCDAVGDMDVVLQIICAMKGVSRSACQAQAWNEIKDRKGMMVGGKFVKEVTNG